MYKLFLYMGFFDRWFPVQKHTEIVNGSTVNMEADVFTIDAFSIGKSGGHYYNDKTNFVNLQETNFVLNNCIGTISKKFSNAIFTDEKDSALLKKLNNPNIDQSKEEFLTEFATFLLSAGWCLIWKRWQSVGNFDTLELINIYPHNVEFTDDRVKFSYGGEDHSILATDTISFYDSRRNAKNKLSYSRIAPLKSQLENVQLAQKAKNIQMQNSGTTIVSPKQVGGGNTIDEGLNAIVPKVHGNMVTQKTEMEDKLNQRGLENRIIVSSKGLDAVNLSEKLNNIDFNKIVEPDALVIYDAFSFPIELTPFGKSSTYDNKQTAELSLLENEVFPLMNNFVSSLNAEFQKYGEVEANYNHLGVMSVIEKRVIETNTLIIDQYIKLLEKGIIDTKKFTEVMIEHEILDK